MAYKEIIDKLKNDGAIYRCQAIFECLERQIQDPEVFIAISDLKNDKVRILGRKISSYALATLDILGKETYKGNDVEVQELIPELRNCFS